MQFVHGYTDYMNQDLSVPLAMAIGMFDGFHIGHQNVIQQTIRIKDSLSNPAQAAAFTFNVHPASVVRPQLAPKLIYPLAKKIHCLEQSGLDHAFVVDFDLHLCHLRPEEFVDQLKQSFPNLKYIIVGHDFGFGHNRQGNVELLKKLEKQHQFIVHVLDPIRQQSQTVSSTRIRQNIQSGRFMEVSELLGRPFTLCGQVQPGQKLARSIGCPTANVDVSQLANPPYGVYAGTCQLNHTSPSFPAIMNIGIRPTLNQEQQLPPVLAEIHIFHFNQDIYNQYIEFSPQHYIRSEIKFPSMEALRIQIASDLELARNLLRL
jgi:riboflavin kinase/FMN adenylyltransferase